MEEVFLAEGHVEHVGQGQAHALRDVAAGGEVHAAEVDVAVAVVDDRGRVRVPVHAPQLGFGLEQDGDRHALLAEDRDVVRE